MHHYRQALLRMRQGDSDRDIAEARIMASWPTQAMQAEWKVANPLKLHATD